MTPYIRSIMKNGYEVHFRQGLLERGMHVRVTTQEGRAKAHTFIKESDLEECGCPQNVLDHIDDAIRKEMK